MIRTISVSRGSNFKCMTDTVTTSHKYKGSTSLMRKIFEVCSNNYIKEKQISLDLIVEVGIISSINHIILYKSVYHQDSNHNKFMMEKHNTSVNSTPFLTHITFYHTR
jgi:hypothetical protein